MMTRVLLLSTILIVGAAAFSANFIPSSVGGKAVKFHVKGQLNEINGLILSPLTTRLTSLADLIKIFNAGTFDADILPSSDGNIDR